MTLAAIDAFQNGGECAMVLRGLRSGRAGNRNDVGLAAQTSESLGNRGKKRPWKHVTWAVGRVKDAFVYIPANPFLI